MINFLNLSPEKPFIIFQSLYQKAIDNGQKGIEAISVSSYNQPLKEVEARYVNLKYIDNNEWIFFSNYLSPKANQFESHNQVSVLIYWASINTQIRMKAKIFKTSSEFSDEHFQGRTKEKNALAISSNQSQVIDSFDEVTKNFHETLQIMTSETPRPDFWGGYSFIPYYFEFWEGHNSRINKRKFYELKNQDWKDGFLQP